MNLSLKKRHKIIISSFVLSLGLLSTQIVPFYLTNRFIIGLSVLAYILSVWALWEGLNKLKGVVLMILPTLFTLAVASYYFLLPAGWWTRIPVALIFGLTFYTLLLSQNVFNVASIRTIPLHRVASTTVFVLTLLTSFLLFNVVFSLNMPFIFNSIVVFFLSLLLAVQIIWSIEMENISSLVVIYSLILSLVIGELSLVLSFWPISKGMASLVLSTGLFVILGISTHEFKERLSRGVVWEYLGWGAAIFIIAAFTTSWSG